MVVSLNTIRRSQSSLPFIGALALLVWLAQPGALGAKQAKQPYRPPLKVVNVTPSPVPFIPGPGSSLALAVTVELPENVDDIDVLEVSTLISFPSRRSIRFLFDRQPLDNVAMEDGKSLKRLTLLWDGKDQHRRYVSPGKYAYTVRAKLMAHEKGFVKSQTVSRFKRGTLDVSSPPDVVEQAGTLEQPPRSQSAPSPEAGAVPRTQDDALSDVADQPPESADAI